MFDMRKTSVTCHTLSSWHGFKTMCACACMLDPRSGKLMARSAHAHTGIKGRSKLPLGSLILCTEAAYTVANGTITASGVEFNDTYRFVDWLLTVPLLRLVELVFCDTPLAVGIHEAGRRARRTGRCHGWAALSR